MFAYCRNNPINRIDYFAHYDSSATEKDKDREQDDEEKQEADKSNKNELQIGCFLFGPIKIYIRCAQYCGKSVEHRYYDTSDDGITELIGRTGTYNQLRKMSAGTGFQVHHIIPQKFFYAVSYIYESRGKMQSVILDAAEHQIYTNLWRAAVPYGTGYNLPTTTILRFANEIYGNSHPEWISSLYE